MRKLRHSNHGVALVTVIMVMLVVMTFAGIVLSLVTSQTKSEVYFEQDTSAIHAAEAGINLYLWDLNEGATMEVSLGTEIKYPDINPTAAFILELDTAKSTTSKKVVRSTGWMLSDSNVKRTIEVTFTKRSFTEFVYFSDNDPDDIWWSSSDNLYGPYHSNTYLCIAGSPTFWGKATYSIDIKNNPNYTNKPTFKKGKEKVASIQFPPNNNSLLVYANNGGYCFDGRTCILLHANGEITVWNDKLTPKVKKMDPPPNGVIYVNEIAGTKYGEFDLKYGNVFVSGTLNGRLTIGAFNDIYITGYDPTKSTFSNSTVTNGIKYNDTSFTLDTSNGNVKVYENPLQVGSDMLGLVARENIAVLTYGWFGTGNENVNSSRQNMTIHAALCAINGRFGNSYQLNNSNVSTSYPTSAGTLTLRGSLMQKERGPVGFLNASGEIGTGYKKDYAHDPRMMYEQPPYFLEPAESGWEIRDWVEK